MSRVIVLISDCAICGSFFFFFKQKTAYEMRISDWSSDVCSSDLEYLSLCQKMPKPYSKFLLFETYGVPSQAPTSRVLQVVKALQPFGNGLVVSVPLTEEIGRASCRERGGQYV